MGLLDKLFGGGKQAVQESRTTITYRAGINESCRSIANRFYGDEAAWERVYRDNERVLKDEVQASTDALLPGTEVTIKGAKYDLSGRRIGADGEKATPIL